MERWCLPLKSASFAFHLERGKGASGKGDGDEVFIHVSSKYGIFVFHCLRVCGCMFLGVCFFAT